MKKSSIITAILALSLILVPGKVSAQEGDGGEYAAPFDPQGFKSDTPKNMYANFPDGIHSMYIGEVVNAWKK